VCPQRFQSPAFITTVHIINERSSHNSTPILGSLLFPQMHYLAQ